MKSYKCKIEKLYSVIVNSMDVYTTQLKRNEKKNLWIMGMLYKFFLDIYYIFVVSEYWLSDGLTCSPSAIKYFASWILYFIGYTLIMSVEDHIISVFLQLQWILTIAPTIVILGVQSNRSVCYIVYILLVVVVQVAIGRNNGIKVPVSFGNENLAQYVSGGLCVAVAAIWIIMATWNDFAGLKAFDIGYIYEMRSKLVYPPMFGYIVSWITRAIIPWLFMIGLHGKRMVLILYSVFFQIMFYMILGHKAPVLLMGIILAVYVASKRKILLLGSYFAMLCALVIGTIGGWLEIKSDVNSMVVINALLGERTLFIPAVIKHQFYEFFSQYPKLFFADGMIGKLLSQTNLYNNSSGFVIYAYNNQGSLAVESNAGYLADSYAQMGVIGMLTIGILVILMVKFVSKYSKHMPMELLCCIVACFSVLLNDGAFFTILLTGGIWIMLGMLTIYTRR